jgi:ABC-type glutathione transport system ATPase component
MVEEQKGIWDSAPIRPNGALLDVQNLRVSYTARTGQCSAPLTIVSLTLQRGETLGVLEESGSGKSTLAAALLRLLPANGRIERGAATSCRFIIRFGRRWCSRRFAKFCQ